MSDAAARLRYHERSDEELVDRVRFGSKAAVDALFDRHHEGLLAFCRHMLGGRAAGEEAVVEAFRQALTALRRHDRPVHLNALLYATARNRFGILGAGHGEATETVGLHPDVRRDPELRAALQALSELPAEQRAALLLIELRRHTTEEIATIVGCSGEKVDALVAAARRAVAGVEDPGEWTCAQARTELAAGDGEPRRESTRRHVAECPGCTAFQEAIAHQRRLLAIVVPVAPSAGLTAPDLDAAEIPAPRVARPAEEPPAANANRTRIAVAAAIAVLVATVAIGAAVTGGGAPSPGAVAPTRGGASPSGAAGSGHAPGTGTTGSVRIGADEDAAGGGLLTRAARDAQRVVDAAGS